MIRLMRNLSSRLILAFVVLIIITTFAAGIPAYFFVQNELDSQVWARVEDGTRVTQTLMQAEESRLTNLATLTAERPTLRRLLQEGDQVALTNYLNTFRTSVDLDFLIIRDTHGEIVVEKQLIYPWLVPPSIEDVAYYSYNGIQPSIALLVSQPLYLDESSELLGYVTLGNVLDDDFATQLATTTGFEQSFLMENSRIASSLSHDTREEVGASFHSEEMKDIQFNEIPIGGTPYYTSLIPILDPEDQPIGFIEVALPIDSLITAERQALLTVAVSIALVIIIGSIIGGLISRRLTNPLRQLTEAASRDDIDTPFPMLQETEEIATLAMTLEGSRVNIKRVLEDLEQAKAWSETLIQSIVEGIVTFDDQGKITSFNQGAEYLTGWSQDEVLQQNLDEILLLPEEEGTISQQLPPSGGSRHIQIITRSGKQMTLAVTSSQLTPPKSESPQSALVLRDITEIEAVRNLRSYFLANISHEFRTPLSAINASVELLLEELEDLSTAEIGELLNSIHMSVSGLQTLIDNLLESLSIEAGRFRIRRRSTDLNTVIQEAVRMMKPLLDRRQQKLNIQNPHQISKVNLDPSRLTQVITNLLSNASKYSPIGKDVDLVVEKLEDDLLRISVVDRGPGIPPVERSDIFRRFVRLDSQEGTQYGIGLGLSVVKTIVEEHGGEIGIEDNIGGGSIFWFTLPLLGVKE